MTRSSAVSFLAVLLLLGSGLTGQASKAPPKAKLLWRLPPYVFVEYQRELSDGIPESFGPEAAAGFYGYEVHKQRSVRYGRYTLPEIIPQIALSLSGHAPKRGARSKVKRKFEDCLYFGRVEARGEIVTEDAARADRVRQRGIIAVSGLEDAPKPRGGRGRDRPAGRRDGPARGLPMARRGPGKLRLGECQLHFTRIVDAVRGRVLSFDANLKGRYVDDGRSRRLDVLESWNLIGLQEPDNAKFRKRVNQAIKLGEDWLIQKAPQEFGHLALTLLAVMKSNPDRDAPEVQGMLARLRNADPRRTYQLAVAIQALEAYYEPPNESAQLRSGQIQEPFPRSLNGEDRGIMAGWLTVLLGNRSSSGGDRVRFHYLPGPNYDNSNSQFAALGLQAAERCGLAVARGVWTGLAKHFLREQLAPEGEAIRIALPSYVELARVSKWKSKGRTRSLRRGPKAKPKGWHYRKHEPRTGGGRRLGMGGGRARSQIAYGSMTCAGVTGLTICRASLGKSKKKSGKFLGHIDGAMREGFAWLYDNYDVRRNPRSEHRWYHYYLYSLERTFELSNIGRINGRHWYFDGAMQLLSTQRPEGPWVVTHGEREGVNVISTCFAVLFLKRAVAPVLTR